MKLPLLSHSLSTTTLTSSVSHPARRTMLKLLLIAAPTRPLFKLKIGRQQSKLTELSQSASSGSGDGEMAGEPLLTEVLRQEAQEERCRDARTAAVLVR